MTGIISSQLSASTLLRLLLAVMVLFLLFSGRSWGAGLTPQEERGKQIYFDGTSPTGAPLVAFFGKDYLEVPGRSATCASCHGYDGLGRTESGVIPSNVTWPYLMKSYGHIHPDGVEHGPFSVASLKSYMRDGVYPGGRLGDPAMPVYDIGEGDLDDLLAYMQRLDTYQDPGLSDAAIRVGTLVPAEGGAADLGEVLRATVQAYFADINSRGGIYGRRLELVAAKTGAGPLGKIVAEQEVFALLNTYTPGLEQELGQLAEQLGIPLIAPFTLLSPEIREVPRYRFFLFAPLRQQVRALARFGTGKMELHDPQVAIIFPRRDGMEEIADAAEAVYRAGGWQKITRREYAPSGFDAPRVLLQLQQEDAGLLLFLGGEAEAEALFRAAAAKNWAPPVFMPGVLLGKALYQVPPLFKDKLWLAFPSLPDDRKEWGLIEFEGVAARQKLAVTHPTAQLAAFAAAKVFVEGLRRAGRDLSRERLVDTLERLSDFDTGLTPLVSYGKNRRHGTLGAHVVGVDPLRAGEKEYIVPQGWINLNN